ncbi:flagellar basal body P-ring formation chaperone FlgA [Pseudoxanthomonas sp. SORGH_AS_0997]|nr:flagellar basal body P-ring formation chaperone FlgA [Pseudoxanthomonas sp. SORGH_AS_0997]
MFLLGMGGMEQSDPVQAIRDCAARAVAERAKGDSGLSWELAGSEATLIAPTTAYELKASAIHGPWPRRKVGVTVELWSEAQKIGQYMVWFNLHQSAKANVYRGAKKRGDVLLPADLSEADVDLMALRSKPGRIAGIGPWRLRRAVAAGQPVMQGDLDEPPTISSGQRVDIHVEHGAVSLVSAGTALEDGVAQGPIRVLPAGSRTPVRGRVVSGTEVRVEP